jgi:hypothetical protein
VGCRRILPQLLKIILATELPTSAMQQNRQLSRLAICGLVRGARCATSRGTYRLPPRAFAAASQERPFCLSRGLVRPTRKRPLLVTMNRRETMQGASQLHGSLLHGLLLHCRKGIVHGCRRRR